MPGTRKLGRDTAHRTAMLRAMVTFLLENGKIETTVTRAKEVRSLTEKMITIAKVNDLHHKRMAMAFITKEGVTKKLFDEIAPKYAEKNGGYTRITKLGPPPRRRRRNGDHRVAVICGRCCDKALIEASIKKGPGIFPKAFFAYCFCICFQSLQAAAPACARLFLF